MSGARAVVCPNPVRRDRSDKGGKLRSLPIQRETAGPNGIRPRRVTKGTMTRYRLDDFIEHSLTRGGRENIALAIIAAGSLAGIIAIGRR